MQHVLSLAALTLSFGEKVIRHALATLQSARCDLFSPEETLPGREVGSFEERVFQNALHATQGLDHVCAVVVQVPQLAVVPLVCPPEGVLLQDL